MSANTSKGLASLGVIGVGVVAYVALLVIQLLTWWGNGGIFNLVTLLILAQLALAWPFVGHLFLGRPLGSVLNYAICFTAAVGVLAVSGNLGIPATEADPDFDRKTIKFALAGQKLAEKKGDLKRLKLQVDRAAAKDEEAKKKVQEKIDEVDKDMSDADKEKLQRAEDVMEAKRRVASWGGGKRAFNLIRSQPVNGLIAVSAFAVLLGAMGGGIGSAAPKPDKPAPAPEPEKAPTEEPPKKKAASKKKAATKKAAPPDSE